jgi:hypothetical protein
MSKSSLSYLVLFAISLFAAPMFGAELSEKDKAFLTGYTKIEAALAADDLDAAKSFAADLGDEAGDLVKAASLKDARGSFEKLSGRAKTLTEGDKNYHVFYCPMLKKEWVQTSTTAANPYAGKSMAGCGEMKK